MPLNLQLVRHDLACIDVTTMRGLEIGPLAAPRVRKDEGDIFYVDHTDAEGLRSKYATNSVLKDSLDQIVEIDRVIGDGLGIREAVADRAPFDYVIASHLIEHIPDPVTWLSDIASVLRPRGILSLVIPDKRFTFDINRRTTEIGDLVDAYLRRLRIPSFRQAYDFISKEITQMVDPAAVWAGTADFTGVVRSDVPDPDVAALQLCRTIAKLRRVRRCPLQRVHARLVSRPLREAGPSRPDRIRGRTLRAHRVQPVGVSCEPSTYRCQPGSRRR